MTTQPEPDSLRQRIADAVQPLLMDTLPKPIARARAQDVADAVLAVVQPVIDEAQQRAEAAEAMTDEVTKALRLANRELDAVATKWDADLDKRTADLTERASTAEAALARVRDLVADMQGVTGARWWADQLTSALSPPVPADGPEGGAQ